MVNFLTNRLIGSLTKGQMKTMLAEHGALEATYMAAIMTGEDGRPLYPQAASRLVETLTNAGHSDLAKDSEALGQFLHTRYQDIYDLAKLRNDNGITIGDSIDFQAASDAAFASTLKELGLPETLQDPTAFADAAKQHEASLKAAGNGLDLSAIAGGANVGREKRFNIPGLSNAQNAVSTCMSWMRDHRGANVAIGTTTAAGAVGAGVAARHAWRNGQKGKATALAAAGVASAAVSATSWVSYVQSRGSTPSGGRQQ